MNPEQTQTLGEKLEALQATDLAAQNAMLAMMEAINTQASVIESLIAALQKAGIEVELPEYAASEAEDSEK